MLRRASALLLLSLLCVPLAAQPEDAGRTALAFFERWGAGDLAGAERYWADASSDDFHHQVRRVLATSCITLHEARVAGIKMLAGDLVEVETALRLVRRNAMAGAPEHHELGVVFLRLRQDGGVWRIESWVAGEDREVDALLAVPSSAERGEWLDQRMAGWTPALAAALASRAVALTNRDELPPARELIVYAGRLATALADDGALSLVRGAESVLERREMQPDYQRSLALAAEGVALAERTGDPDLIAAALVRLGRSLVYANRLETEPLERVLAMEQFVADETVLSTAASQLSMNYDHLKETRAALLHAATAERYARAGRSSVGMLSAELNFAGAYQHIGDLELAGLHFDRAAKLALANGFHRIYASFLPNIIFARQWRDGSSDELLALIDEGLAIPRVRETPHIVVDLLTVRSGVNIELGRYEQAEADISEALAYEAVAPAPYAFLAELRIRRGQYASALDAATLGRNIEAGAYFVVEALRNLGRIDEAIAIAHCVAEDTGLRLEKMATDPRHRQSFVTGRYAVDGTLVRLLVERGDMEEALLASEAAKGRVLLELTRRPDPGVAAAPDEAERRLTEEVERLNRAMVAERDPARLELHRTELARVRLELSDVRIRNTAGVAPYVQSTAGRSLQWRLPGVVALEYMVGDHETVVFAIRSPESGQPDNGQTDNGRMRLDVRVIQVERQELTALVRQLRARIGMRDLRYAEPARRLYDLLIAPVEPFLASAETLCIIPDSDLWKLPFHALHAPDGRILLDRAAVFYAPSVRMLLASAGNPRPRAARRLLAFGNPSVGQTTVARYRAMERQSVLGDLVEAESEVDRIARIYGRERSAVYIRGDAREAVFKKQAPAFDVLHIASHGLVDDAAPMFSALVLATDHRDGEDGLLEAHEVLGLDLDADLVVLSACETAAGKVGGGEGILGLSWAFLAAGARGLVGSQWKAPSSAAEALMVKFHERVVAGDTPAEALRAAQRHLPAEALRAAQRHLRSSERYSAPLDWAPFIVVGDGLATYRR